MAAVSLVTLAQVGKRFGSQDLFSNLTFSVNQNDRIGLIGPNGKGKSTLLKIISGQEQEDKGTIFRQRDLRVVHIAQSPDFSEDKIAFDVVHDCAKRYAISDADSMTQSYLALGAVGFEQEGARISTLSGGQRKKLQIACGLASSPDLLLLDEPTNHLDISSIIALEKLLAEASFTWITVSHDRWFLENAVNRIAEVNPCYPNGIFTCDGSYSEYLQRSSEFLEAQRSQQASLENKVRGEQEWLRRGAKARTTKSKSRSSKAYEMMDSLSLVRKRNREDKVNLAFNSSERQTKKLVELTNVSLAYGEMTLISQLDIKIMAGEALGILGGNGVGKSSLMKLIAGELEPTTGTIKRAVNLQIAQFKQVDSSIADDTPLKEVLADESDTVIYKGKAVHVSSWASRFGFSFSQLNQPFGSLSGGEKARARISLVMRQTPDILLLDEPTNDLDIQTLEVLESSLADFDGALILVTHDRFMINRLCTRFVGLDGAGEVRIVADYQQWEQELESIVSKNDVGVAKKVVSNRPEIKNVSQKLRREYQQIEQKIEKAEAKVSELNQLMISPEMQQDLVKLEQLCVELNVATKEVENLYVRWQELEEMLG